MRIVVYHGGYGCDTGCCGHYIEVDGEDRPGSFTFDHPDWVSKSEPGWVKMDDEQVKQWVIDYVEEQVGSGHLDDIDWEKVRVSQD